MTRRHYGDADELLKEYAWYSKTTNDEGTRAGGLLKPNGILVCEDGDLTSSGSEPPSALGAFADLFGRHAMLQTCLLLTLISSALAAGAQTLTMLLFT